MTNFELQELKEAMKRGFFTCFRTGVWIDSSGKRHDITQGDLEAIQDQYNTKTNNNGYASLFVGHDGKEKAGKISTIIKYGDYLLAKAADIKNEILEKIKQGVYKFVSIAMNPRYELEHIALTNDPAVDGLLPIQGAFSTGMTLFQFEIQPADKTGKINQLYFPEEIAKEMQFNKTNNIKEVLMEPDEKEKGKQQEDKTSTAQDNTAAQFAKSLEQAKEKADAAEKKAAEFERQLNEEKKQRQEAKEKQRQTDISSFCKTLVEKKKLYPIEVEPMTQFLLIQESEKTHQFAKEQTPLTPFGFFSQFLEKLPDRLPLDAIPTVKGTSGKVEACFSRLEEVDEEDLEKHNKALALMKEKEIPYAAALALQD